MVKIIATLGPKSRNKEIISKLIDVGVNVFRFNFSHADYKEFEKTLETINHIKKTENKKIQLLADTKGPEIRTGAIEKEFIYIEKGSEIKFTHRDVLGNEEIITINYPYLETLKPRTILKIDDGKYKFRIKDVSQEYLVCIAETNSYIYPRKSVSIENHDYKLKSISQKDIEDINFALKHNFDFIALSFVRNYKDVLKAKELIKNKAKIISKIEDWKGYNNLDKIIQESYGIMVARGDLGVETGVEKVGILQKKIIHQTKSKNKKVIVATHMLESMINETIPTRAEVTDITNAILDGADYLMLSGETAIGKDPVNVVKTMKQIINYVLKEKQNLIR